MEDRPVKLSVTCMAYNHEKYIRQTLEGFVSQQTDFAFEVLVNDDLSTDGTAAVIREYTEKYPDIIRPFFQEKNLFSQHIDPLDAVLFPAARGQYLAACEGDDCWIDPTKLQRQVDFLDAHPARRRKVFPNPFCTPIRTTPPASTTRWGSTSAPAKSPSPCFPGPGTGTSASRP